MAIYLISKSLDLMTIYGKLHMIYGHQIADSQM